MKTGLTPSEELEVVQSWQEDPVVRHYCFSDKVLWQKQEEILRAMRKYKRVAVKSGNTVGKSFTAADVALDWLLTRHNSVVVTTAPTFHQVETILWREIRHACYSSKIPIGVEPLQTELKLSEKWYAIGVSTDKPVNFQGKHSESGNLLVLLDEASGISTEIWDMVEALHPKGILAIGNPLESVGKFAECFQSPMWHNITISGVECIAWQDKHGVIPGLVTMEWVKDMAELHGRNSTWYRVHVLGEFPEQDEQALISRVWVDRARKGLDADEMPMDEELEESSSRIVSCDIASKHGSNETVIIYRYGHTFKDIKVMRQATMTFIRDELEAKHTKVEAHTLVTDSDGLGESMAELLSEVHVPCLEFHGGYGAKALDGAKFRNLRTQFYWILAKKFEKGLYNLKHLPEKEFEILRGQLCSIKVKAPDALGRLQIETKEDMLARGIKSPDYADSLMMSEYANFMRKFAELRPRQMGVL